MNPNLFGSLFGNIRARFSNSKRTSDSSNFDNKASQGNKNQSGVQVIINGNVYSRSSDNPRNKAAIFKEGYHAVFLDNSHVYFGKLEVIDKQRFVKLTHVYYLKEISGEINATNLNLIKLGGEVHAPSDEMNINVDKIIFWEKLKDEGAVVSAISQYEVEHRHPA